MSRVVTVVPDLDSNGVYTAWQIMGALGMLGHETMLAGTSEGRLWPPLAHELQSATRLEGRWAGLPRGASLARLLDDASMVYAFKALPTSLALARRVGRKKGVPVALHLEEWDAGFFESRSWARRQWWGLRALANPRGDLWLRLTERLIPEVDALTVSTRTLQRRFGGTLVRHGVDTDRYAPERFPRHEARDRLGLDDARPMVLFLGTPRQHKGLAALDALGPLAEDIWFVGASEEALRQAAVPESLIEKAEIRGPVPFDEAAWYFAACDVFVVPQTPTPYAEHQLPAKILQGMALGAPIVTTDVGDARELLGGDPAAGVVVPPGDPRRLAEAVRALLGDHGRRRGMAVEARRRAVGSLGWGSMAERLRTVLEGLGIVD